METLPSFKDIQQKIGGNIEHARLLKKKTVKEMVRSLQLTESGYRNIERGITALSVSKLFQIAAILNIRCTALLQADEYHHTHDEGNAFSQMTSRLEKSYENTIQQYVNENAFLKKRIEILEGMLVGKRQG
jgi:transcriptional regulator with XRE-family HTH domain